ncbi:MAG: sodium:proton antiporter [Pyramidobacter sp.]|nr:sodium:proton antiporter [Pyramidobacter sp.]
MRYIIGMLLAGFVCFFLLGLRKGFSFRELCGMTGRGAREAIDVGKMLLLIGMVTGVWRVSGTIVQCVHYGIAAITPRLFLLIVFAVTCGLSYALGTSFGVVGTAGVIFMTLARGGGVNTAVAAGVILSGIYFGDRSSPIASTAIMTAQVTKTDLYGNVRRMMRTGAVPLALTFAFYACLSVMHPLNVLDENALSAFAARFVLSPWTMLPAALMLILPLAGVKVKWAIAASVIAGAAVAHAVQGFSLAEIARVCALGYRSAEGGATAILDGGGMISMLGSAAIVTISCASIGLADGAHLLEGLHSCVKRVSARLGRFPAMMIVCLGAAAVFCNQVIAIVSSHAFLWPIYERGGLSREDLADDIENSAILLPALIPWCILGSVPLAILGETYAAMPFAVYVYAVPLWTMIHHALHDRRAKNGKK